MKYCYSKKDSDGVHRVVAEIRCGDSWETINIERPESFTVRVGHTEEPETDHTD